VAPVFGNGWAYLGEVAKFVTVSPQRTLEVDPTPDGILVKAAGVPGEVIDLVSLNPSLETVTRTVTFDAAGVAVVYFSMEDRR
jgi:hypothetical protein